jgi:hypothetical protein
MARSNPKVLDFSFMDISEVEGVKFCSPGPCVRVFMPHHTSGIFSELGEKLDDMSVKMSTSVEGSDAQTRVSASALRLCNNGISELVGLFVSASSIVKDPTRLKWIDLSFNSIEIIPEVKMENFTHTD